ncbi:MAG: hypothetical protein ACXV76_11895 [Halobacteriota archaeon]
MQILGLILILINVGAIVGPIAGVVVIYSNSLQEIVIPPEVQNIVGNTINTLTLTSPNNPSNAPNQGDSSNVNLQMPQYVSASFDPVARTVTAVFNFTNPFNVSLAINALSADVQCHAHSFVLGHAELSNPVTIPAMETQDITIVFTYTDAAQQHFLIEHAGQSTVNVDLKNITINVSGITVETPEVYNVDIPIYS